MYLFYSALLTSGAILGTPYWVYKAVRERKYLQNFRQRLSWRLPSPVRDGPLWIHAVSVGEVLAARVLLHAIRQSRPQLPIVVSTVTLTGQNLACREMPEADAVFFFPFDWQFSVRRFLNTIRPRAVVLMETEIWPNFLKCAAGKKIPVALANGRISDKTFGGYRRIRRLLSRVFGQIQVIGVQTQEDRRRFLAIGAADSQIKVTGNLKFDMKLPHSPDQDPLLAQIRESLTLSEHTPVIVAGSTMRGEEPILLDAFRRIRERIPDTRLILAPRHPERFDEVAETVREFGLVMKRRTDINLQPTSTPCVFLLDTIGELATVYHLATVAIVCGSFLPFGGHNLLEPAALGKAVVFGPEMSNFREMARLFIQEQAARQCTREELSAAILELLENSRARAVLGQRALAVIRQNQGATERTLSLLRPLLD